VTSSTADYSPMTLLDGQHCCDDDDDDYYYYYYYFIYFFIPSVPMIPRGV